MTTEEILKNHQSPTPSKWRVNAEKRRRFRYVRHIKNYILLQLLSLKDLIYEQIIRRTSRSVKD
jgi:hypothetical protein